MKTVYESEGCKHCCAVHNQAVGAYHTLSMHLMKAVSLHRHYTDHYEHYEKHRRSTLPIYGPLAERQIAVNTLPHSRNAVHCDWPHRPCHVMAQLKVASNKHTRAGTPSCWRTEVIIACRPTQQRHRTASLFCLPPPHAGVLEQEVLQM